MQRFSRYAWLIVVACPTVLAAQGFGVYEQNTCSMARGGAAAAAPCADGSAIFFNPAGLAGLKGGHVTLGTTLIKVQGGFTDDLFLHSTDLDDPLLYVPQAYVTYAVTPKVGVGVGLFAPYGLETRWPLSFDGRFSGYDNIIHTFYVQPTAAYQVTPWLKLGGGLDIVHGTVELHQRIDLSQTPLIVGGVNYGTFGQFGIAPGTDFADADLSASKTNVGGHFGAIAKATERLTIGVHYLMKVNLNYAGTGQFTQVLTNIVTPADITIPTSPTPTTIPAGTNLDQLIGAPTSLGGLGVFSPGGLLAGQAVTASIPNPDMLVAGVAFKATGNVTLLADYQWTHWSTFDTLQPTSITAAPRPRRPSRRCCPRASATSSRPGRLSSSRHTCRRTSPTCSSDRTTAAVARDSLEWESIPSRSTTACTRSARTSSGCRWRSRFRGRP